MSVSPTGFSPSLTGLPMPFGYRLDFLLCPSLAVDDWQVPRPLNCNGCILSRNSGLGSSAFARHYLRNHSCFLFLEVLRCFSSLGCLHTPMYSVCSPGPSRPGGSPIRTSTPQGSLTAPRGISVFAPSFFGSWHLGILRAPFLPSPSVVYPLRSSSSLQPLPRSRARKHAPFVIRLVPRSTRV